jgi:hypothetical protein
MSSSPNDPVQLPAFDNPEAEYAQHPNNRLKIAGVVLLGALAFSGCNNQGIDAEVPDSPLPGSPTTSEITPSQAPENDTKLEMAKAALAEFEPDEAPVLTNFSANTNHEQGAKDAERYLKSKDSRLVLVNFSSTSPAEVEQLAERIEEAVPEVTAGTVKVDVDVVQASPEAKQLYNAHNPNHVFNPGDDKNYGSVMAAAVMPDLNQEYNSIIALTDSHFPQDGTAAENNGGLSLSGGKYADIMDVAGTEPLTTENRTLHELFHTVLRLQHAKTVEGDLGDFASAFPADPSVEQRANLADFLSHAWFKEYGQANIMGDDSALTDTPPLTTAQLDALGAAERELDMPYPTKHHELSDQNPVIFNEQSSTNAVASYTLDELMGLRGRTDQGVNGFLTLDFAQQYYAEGVFGVSVDAVTIDNGTVRLMNMQISSNPTEGRRKQIIDLPNGKSIAVSVTETDELQIAVN